MERLRKLLYKELWSENTTDALMCLMVALFWLLIGDVFLAFDGPIVPGVVCLGIGGAFLASAYAFWRDRRWGGRRGRHLRGGGDSVYGHGLAVGRFDPGFHRTVLLGASVVGDFFSLAAQPIT